MRTVYSVSIAIPVEHLDDFQNWLKNPGENVFGATILGYQVLDTISNLDRCIETQEMSFMKQENQ